MADKHLAYLKEKQEYFSWDCDRIRGDLNSSMFCCTKEQNRLKKEMNLSLCCLSRADQDMEAYIQQKGQKFFEWEDE